MTRSPDDPIIRCSPPHWVFHPIPAAAPSGAVFVGSRTVHYSVHEHSSPGPPTIAYGLPHPAGADTPAGRSRDGRRHLPLRTLGLLHGRSLPLVSDVAGRRPP